MWKKKKYESHNVEEFAVLKAYHYQTAFQGSGGEEGGCERVLSASLYNCT